jgi:hypothetical protein
VAWPYEYELEDIVAGACGWYEDGDVDSRIVVFRLIDVMM